MNISPVSQVNSNTYNKNTSFSSAQARIYRSAEGVAREAENTYLQKFFEKIRSIARVSKRKSTQNAEVFIPMPRGRKPSVEEIDMVDRAREVYKRSPI